MWIVVTCSDHVAAKGACSQFHIFTHLMIALLRCSGKVRNLREVVFLSCSCSCTQNQHWFLQCPIFYRQYQVGIGYTHVLHVYPQLWVSSRYQQVYQWGLIKRTSASHKTQHDDQRCRFCFRSQFGTPVNLIGSSTKKKQWCLIPRSLAWAPPTALWPPPPCPCWPRWKPRGFGEYLRENHGKTSPNPVLCSFLLPFYYQILTHI